ncbi:ATP-binding protein [Curtobacterium sp. VKM Ac-1376]|uniref:ATP-binding protein n=1 Tax=Curtobacterium sp. VKM Ac-1376 TaxID=123312 RepID=UPI00188C5FC5|nr:ATP-binding protein [Curtobacterium sp. VKM Ac-1376]MBF4615385.1 ATP-binding protein [Curtobacterium sp. VKM Ac-1376]
MQTDGAGDISGIHGPAWERTVLLRVPPNDVDEVHESIDDLWHLNADLGDGERIRFETAMVELAGNVIDHAEGDERLLCELTLRRTSTSLEAVLSDSSAEVHVPFRAVMPDPEEMAESGRGIAMIELLMDDFSYERDSHGNKWRLVMRLPAALQRDHHVADSRGGDEPGPAPA